MITFAKRNLLIFFRDKSAVFFSLLGVIIIIGLYVLFLGENISGSLKDIKNSRFLMDSWIMAGLLAVTSITTTMGAFGIMVDDKAKKIEKDFLASPIKNSSLIGGYILSSFVIGVVMSIFTLILGEVYIVANGGEMLSLNAFIKVFGLIIISVLSSSALVFFIVSFFKSQNAFATASTIIGTLIGFLTGIYIPVGVLPEAIQFVVKVFPVSHAGVLFRQVMMEEPMKVAFLNAPKDVIENFNEELGLVFKFGDYNVSFLESIIVLVVSTIIFYLLANFKLKLFSGRKN